MIKVQFKDGSIKEFSEGYSYDLEDSDVINILKEDDAYVGCVIIQNVNYLEIE